MGINYEEVFTYLNKFLEKSPAKKRKVASVFVDENGIILEQTVSVNCILDAFTVLYPAELRCETEDCETYNSVFHAEEQTIFKAMRAALDCSRLTLVCTYSPCYKCCRSLILSGCKSLIYFDEHPSNFVNPEIEGDFSPKSLLQRYGVKIMRIQKHKVSTKINKSKRQKSTIVIHHSADMDGIMSGWLLNQMVQTLDGIQPIIYGYNYQSEHVWMENLRKLIELNKYDFELIFGDITPPMGWLKENLHHLESGLIRIIIFDHHQQALDNILAFIETHNLSSIIIVTDDENSAAKIIHNYLKDHHRGAFPFNSEIFCNDGFQDLIDAISLYDTWKFTQIAVSKKENILAIHEFYLKYPDFETFQTKFNPKDIHIQLPRIIEFGKQMIIQKTNKARQITKSSIVTTLKISDTVFKNLWVIGDNYPDYYLSVQLENKPCNYWIGWKFDLQNNLIKFSVRAKNDIPELDVRPLVNHYGGGGHQKAGGFSLPLTDGMEFISKLIEFK